MLFSSHCLKRRVCVVKNKAQGKARALGVPSKKLESFEMRRRERRKCISREKVLAECEDDLHAPSAHNTPTDRKLKIMRKWGIRKADMSLKAARFVHQRWYGMMQLCDFVTDSAYTAKHLENRRFRVSLRSMRLAGERLVRTIFRAVLTDFDGRFAQESSIAQAVMRMRLGADWISRLSRMRNSLQKLRCVVFPDSNSEYERLFGRAYDMQPYFYTSQIREIPLRVLESCPASVENWRDYLQDVANCVPSELLDQDEMSTNLIRILLVISGIEQNPGPQQPAPSQQHPHSPNCHCGECERAREMDRLMFSLALDAAEDMGEDLGPASRDQILAFLLQSGVEPNPGPSGDSVQPVSIKPKVVTLDLNSGAVQPSSQPSKKCEPDSCDSGRGPHNVKSPVKTVRVKSKGQLINESLIRSNQQRMGEIEALREAAKSKEEYSKFLMAQHAEYKKQMEESLAEVTKSLNEAKRQGFAERDDEAIRVTVFHGRYVRNGDSTFRNGLNNTDIDPTTGKQIVDPIVTVWEYEGNRYRTDVTGVISDVTIPPCMVEVASTGIYCTNNTQRMRNIYAGMKTNKACREYVESLPPEELFDFNTQSELIAFILTGIIATSGNVRWLNDCSEWVLDKYELEPPSAEVIEKIRREVRFADNSLKFEATHARNCRAAPIVVEGVVPHMPNGGHQPTVMRGMDKRMFPDLPFMTPEAFQALAIIADDLVDYITHHFTPSDILPIEELLNKALQGHNQAEAESIRRGFYDAKADSQKAIQDYCTYPYKCFIKLEAYPEGSFKPPRFIQSMDPWCRGVQIFFMAPILHMIEVGTRECNVKGRLPDAITMLVQGKIEPFGLGIETDFSAFESCITPRMKSVVENRIFHGLATQQCEHDFIHYALERTTVNVLGPCFTIPHYHHIRMSGDLWTSIGNLVTNICVMTYCTEMPISDVIHYFVFEGDDGAGPLLKLDPDRIIARSKDCGVKLELLVGPWNALSFCGNRFNTLEDGTNVRYRDPHKSLANSTLLINAPRGSVKYDLMLQRSKILAYLQGPVVPDAYVVYAAIERFTRGHTVDESKLRRMGLMKEYSGMGTEKCVPDYLKFTPDGRWLTDEQFVDIVYLRNKWAGGVCPRATIVKYCEIFRSVGDGFSRIVLPSPFASENQGAWYERSGMRFSRVEYKYHIFPLQQVNDVQTPMQPSYFPALTSPCQTYSTVFRNLFGMLYFPSERSRKGSIFPSARVSWTELFVHVLKLVIIPLMVMFYAYMLYMFIQGLMRQAEWRRLYNISQSCTSYNPATGLPYSEGPFPQCIFMYEAYEPEPTYKFRATPVPDKIPELGEDWCTTKHGLPWLSCEFHRHFGFVARAVNYGVDTVQLYMNRKVEGGLARWNSFLLQTYDPVKIFSKLDHIHDYISESSWDLSDESLIAVGNYMRLPREFFQANIFACVYYFLYLMTESSLAGPILLAVNFAAHVPSMLFICFSGLAGATTFGVASPIAVMFAYDIFAFLFMCWLLTRSEALQVTAPDDQDPPGPSWDKRFDDSEEDDMPSVSGDADEDDVSPYEAVVAVLADLANQVAQPEASDSPSEECVVARSVTPGLEADVAAIAATPSTTMTPMATVLCDGEDADY